MAISVTTIGQNTDSAGATVAITVGVGGVPSGALIFACNHEQTNTASDGSIADTGSNTYTKISRLNPNASSNSGFGITWYVKNCAALVNTNTITYTKQTSGNKTAFSAFYATGIDTTAPLDTAVTATATGSSATPTATSGTPGVSGELFAAAIVAVGMNTFSQDTGHSWASPLDTASTGTTAGNASVVGGNQVNAGTGTIIYAPTWSGSRAWAEFIHGFKAAAGSARTAMYIPGRYGPVAI